MYVFVILHYLAEEMTKECISCLENKFVNEDYKIVIVDNASPNGSGTDLKNYYKEDDHCDIILHDKNDGFARGNNVGYRYAKEKYDPEFIIVMNNDVLIYDELFLKKIKEIYEETQYYILGPDIISKASGLHQNPVAIKGINHEDVYNLINVFKRQLFFCKFPIVYYFKKKFKIKYRIKKLLGKSVEENSECPEFKERVLNPILHGACFIFSRDYIQKEENAFDSRTFLYHEEEILHTQCMKKNYLMLYDPSIKVYHLEDVSTDASLNLKKQKNIFDTAKKDRFLFENHLQSTEILINVLENNK